jgi:hypothetical protein
MPTHGIHPQCEAPVSDQRSAISEREPCRAGPGQVGSVRRGVLANELAVGGEVPTRAKLVLHDLCDAELFAGPHGVIRYDRWFRQRSMPTAAPPAAIWDARAVNRRRLVVLMPTFAYASMPVISVRGRPFAARTSMKTCRFAPAAICDLGDPAAGGGVLSEIESIGCCSGSCLAAALRPPSGVGASTAAGASVVAVRSICGAEAVLWCVYVGPAS